MDKKAAAIRAALINLLGDIFKSTGIITVALILQWQPDWYLLDPIYTLVLSLLIIWTSRDLAYECIHELLGGAPEDLDILKLHSDLASIHGVTEVHDLHVWNLIEGTMAIAVHVLVDDEHQSMSRGRRDKRRDRVLEKATRISHKFGIFHTTIQVQSKEFDVDDMVPLLCR